MEWILTLKCLQSSVQGRDHEDEGEVVEEGQEHIRTLQHSCWSGWCCWRWSGRTWTRVSSYRRLFLTLKNSQLSMKQDNNSNHHSKHDLLLYCIICAVGWTFSDIPAQREFFLHLDIHSIFTFFMLPLLDMSIVSRNWRRNSYNSLTFYIRYLREGHISDRVKSDNCCCTWWYKKTWNVKKIINKK